jgi:peptidase C39-like protein
MSLPFVELILQRGKGDCGIAALAMLLGRSYEDVFAVAITKSLRNPHQTGMYTRQLQAAAKRLGSKLRLKRTWDIESSVGLLTVEKVNRQADDFAQHLVLLKFGLIFDTDGTIWEPADYMEQQGFRPVSILVEDGDQ